MINLMLKEKYVFTLKEICNYFNFPTFELYDQSEDFVNDFEGLTDGLKTGAVSSADKPYYNAVLNLIYDEYRNIGAIEVDDDDLTLHDEEAKEFLMDLFTRLRRVAPRYLKLLKLYASEDSKLLDPISVSGGRVMKLNNTPQSEDSSDVYAEMPYVNSATKELSKTDSDGASKIQRLDEIASGYRNLLDEWARNIDELFIY